MTHNATPSTVILSEAKNLYRPCGGRRLQELAASRPGRTAVAGETRGRERCFPFTSFRVSMTLLGAWLTMRWGKLRHCFVLPLILLLAAQVAGEAEPAKAPVRFAAVEVFIDSGEQPIAAWQFQLAAERGDVKIVGIERGEHPAFSHPPGRSTRRLGRVRCWRSCPRKRKRCRCP